MRAVLEKSVLAISGVCGVTDWETVTSALEGIPGVREVRVSLYRANAIVIHAQDCPSGHLVHAIENIGFQAVVTDYMQKSKGVFQ